MLKNLDINSLLIAIKQNDNAALKHLYQNNFRKIEVLILKNSGTTEMAKDIYQEAFLVTWQKIKSEAFVPTSESNINGFLYTVAKNKWMDVLRSKAHKNTLQMSQLDQLQLSQEESIEDYKSLNDERLELVMRAFATLGEECKALLKKFYFEKQSMKVIASELTMDAASTRNKKYRCMQKLRDITLNNS